MKQTLSLLSLTGRQLKWYLIGAIVESSGDIKSCMKDRAAKASRACGVLRKPVFADKDLSLKNKRL